MAHGEHHTAQSSWKSLCLGPIDRCEMQVIKNGPFIRLHRNTDPNTALTPVRMPPTPQMQCTLLITRIPCQARHTRHTRACANGRQP